MASYSASASLKSIPAEFRGTLASGAASCLCAFTRAARASEPCEYGDQTRNALALWFVAADLPTLPATYGTVTVDGETWNVRAVNRVGGGLVRLELEA